MLGIGLGPCRGIFLNFLILPPISVSDWYHLVNRQHTQLVPATVTYMSPGRTTTYPEAEMNGADGIQERPESWNDWKAGTSAMAGTTGITRMLASLIG
jgi:hypothetical protein